MPVLGHYMTLCDVAVIYNSIRKSKQFVEKSFKP